MFGLFGLDITYNLVRNAPIKLTMGVPDCSQLARSKSNRSDNVVLDRWHLYSEPSSNAYFLSGCISNHTTKALDASQLAGHLSYVYFEDDNFLADGNSVLDSLLSLQEGTHNIAFKDVPPSESRPFLVRRSIDAKTIRETEKLELGIYQIQWANDTKTQSRALDVSVAVPEIASPMTGNACEGLLGMTGEIAVGDLSIRRDAFGLLHVEGCLRNGTNATVGNLALTYIDAADSANANAASKTMPLSLDETLESGALFYIREPIFGSETDLLLQSITWRDFDESEIRTTNVTQVLQYQN